MIDATTFATQHNAFWALHAPTSEHFVRRLNLELVERWDTPLKRDVHSSRPALVAELGFSEFLEAMDAKETDEIRPAALRETIKRLGPLTNEIDLEQRPISPEEEKEIKSIQERLTSYFKLRKKDIISRPLFKGCGYIDASEADLLSGETLYEIKTVDRSFRSIDIRQLVTYCALNSISKEYYISSAGLFNPRKGMYFEASCEDICQQISGVSSQELFDKIVHAVSSGDISR